MVNKVVCVASICGRCGTSLTIGLLGMSGVDIGTVGTVTDSNNEKGYNEINELQEWMFNKLGLNGFMVEPNYYEMFKKIADCKSELQYELSKHFTSNFIALKTPYYIPIDLFSSYKTIVISLTRNRKAQAQSIQKMNSTQGDFRKWLKRWDKEADKYYSKYIDIEIPFRNWYSKPYETYREMCNIVKPPIRLTKEQVLNYIDPKLKHY